MFDVNAPETMLAMKKWWADFCDRAPVANDADMNDYCCVVVGNKIDMVGKGGGDNVVSESEALEFLDELVPPSDISILPPSISSRSPQFPTPSSSFSSTNISTRTPSIAIAPQPRTHHHTRESSHSPKHQLSKSRSRSSSRFYSGTMTTTHTTLTIYHTPSSSYYQSARSSPEPWSSSVSNSSLSEVETISPSGSVRRRSTTILSSNSTSSGSAPTITPSLYARESAAAAGVSTPSVSPLIPSSTPIPPERGPKLFFTSAKTGEGVADVFEYIAQRVVRRWEYEEWVEARTMHFREASSANETVRLGSENRTKKVSYL
ncbi:hypothetical protein JR316_0011276 [Psilocybe cubensis]|uniref:Uncharacterized protein n=2 Tax=Psilocybe cubensis TaxID=181762 RepID=A0ACB8GK05_PSICU|nr:hypothetical protein JR316_0011276 [Psilocybe cubensis]KAH9475717.1 hypothetical protein JR316_0011276 [Psilocybe cubensis]